MRKGVLFLSAAIAIIAAFSRLDAATAPGVLKTRVTINIQSIQHADAAKTSLTDARYISSESAYNSMLEFPTPNDEAEKAIRKAAAEAAATVTDTNALYKTLATGTLYIAYRGIEERLNSAVTETTSTDTKKHGISDSAAEFYANTGQKAQAALDVNQLRKKMDELDAFAATLHKNSGALLKMYNSVKAINVEAVKVSKQETKPDLVALAFHKPPPVSIATAKKDPAPPRSNASQLRSRGGGGK